MRFLSGNDVGLLMLAAWRGGQPIKRGGSAPRWRPRTRKAARGTPLETASLFVFYLVLFLCVSTWASAQTQPPAGLATEIRETEGNLSGIWKWNNGHFDASWNNGAIATLSVQFAAQSVTFNRTDSKGSTPGLTAVYTGQISSEGCSINNGQVTWTWPGHFAQPPTGAWKAGWVMSAAADPAAPCPQPAPNDIVIYQSNGVLVHSGVITRVESKTGPDGKPVVVITRITSKWGPLGLYQHDPLDVPSNYGNWAVYHTPRGSNMLKTAVVYVGPFSTTHYVTDGNVIVEVFFLDQDYQSILQYFKDYWIILNALLSSSTPTVDQASSLINTYPWWANPTGSPQCSHLYDRLTPVGKPSLVYDCHGYTFANGTVIINNASVGFILRDNDYHPLPAYDTKMVLHMGPEP
jgi:hypothetical protein